MLKIDRDHTVIATRERDIGGELQNTLSTHEVGVEIGTERIAPPRHTGDVNAHFMEQGVIKGHAQGRVLGQWFKGVTANHGKDLLAWEAMLREESVIGRPIVELLTAGSEQASDGVTTETKEAAQGECFGATSDALLGEGWGALSPEPLEGGEEVGRVFFKGDGGGLRRRRARRLLSSMDHSTVSPREKSRAWATAEGKLMYHCSLERRLMSWTLVGKPIDI
jgi:hypothetical protein